MRSLRNVLQFTQQEIALLLGVSRSSITMYENGHRELTASASSLETLLTKCYAVACKKPNGPGNENQDEAIQAAIKKDLDYELSKAMHYIDEYKAALKKMKANYLQLQLKLATLKDFKNCLEIDSRLMQPGSNELNNTLKRIRHVQHFEEETRLQQKGCEPARQLQLQYLLDCQLAQKQAAERILKRII